MVRGLIVTCIAGAACALAGTAKADPFIIAGSEISITGNAEGLGPYTGNNPYSNEGVPVNEAVGIDFLTGSGGTLTAGPAAGTLSVGSGTDTFSGLAPCQSAAFGGCGTIQDLTSFTVPSGGIAAFYQITDSGMTVTFNLDSISDITRSSSGVGNLTIDGTGTFDLAGYAETPASFTLTTQGNQFTTFSASTQAVPEPASLALFGLGAGVLGLIRRKRMQAGAGVAVTGGAAAA